MEKKLGNFKHNSIRRQWAADKEDYIASLLSADNYGVEYDVTPVQSAAFSAYGYTEFATGMMIYTLSTEINQRLMLKATEEEIDHVLIKHIIENITDKYMLQEGMRFARYVVFLPGNNMWSMINFDLIDRLISELPEIKIKPHPLTNEDNLRMLRQRVGDYRLLSNRISAVSLLTTAEKIWTTTSSELGIFGTLLGKPVYDVTKWEYVSSGSYSSIMLPVFKAQHHHSPEVAKDVISRILSARYNGILLPPHMDLHDRVSAYMETTKALSALHAPVAPSYKKL